MAIAIHARKVNTKSLAVLEAIYCLANRYQKQLFLSEHLASLLKKSSMLYPLPTFTLATLHALNVSLVVSLGGDGTFLEVARYVPTDVPFLGINSGNLGFLTMVTQQNAVTRLTHFLEGSYHIEPRTLLHLQGKNISDCFALNEIALLKRDTASLLAIDAYIDEQLITTYWSDGVIIATPTGSTAYSMSCFGPIILPSARSFVITPVNPHNLAVRPLVVPEAAKLDFVVKRQNGPLMEAISGIKKISNWLYEDMIIAVDGNPIVAPIGEKLTITKAPFTLKTVQFQNSTIFDVLREKFYWGVDYRNKK